MVTVPAAQYRTFETPTTFRALDLELGRTPQTSGRTVEPWVGPASRRNRQAACRCLEVTSYKIDAVFEAVFEVDCKFCAGNPKSIWVSLRLSTAIAHSPEVDSSNFRLADCHAVRGLLY